MAKKQDETESKVLDSYLKSVETKGLLFEPYRKISPIGMKVLPRTIPIAQDRKLMEIAEKTGRKISKLVREVVKDF